MSGILSETTPKAEMFVFDDSDGTSESNYLHLEKKLSKKNKMLTIC